MAVITSLPSQSIIDGYKGLIDFYCDKGQYIARKWPRAPAYDRTWLVLGGTSKFTVAQATGGTLPLDVVEDYQKMAVGQPYVWRDWMTRLYLSGKSVVNEAQV